MKPWKRVEPTTIQKVGWRTIVTKTFEMPDGVVGPWDTIHPEGQQAAVGIALTQSGEVIICQQFRPGPERIMQELPNGFVDQGETPEHAMRRELREEAGYEVGQAEYLGEVHKDAYMNGVWHIFLLTDCVPAKGQELDIGEDITVRLVGIDELLAIAKRGETTDAGAIFMAYDKLVALKEGLDD